MKKGNYIAAAAFAALAIYVIWECSSFPPGKGRVPGPALYPVAIAVLMLMASISLVITSLRMTPEENTRIGLFEAGNIRVYMCMAILAAYTALVPVVGFCVMSVLLLFGLIMWFGRYKFHICALAAIAVTGVIYVVFSEVFHVPFRFGFLM